MIFYLTHPFSNSLQTKFIAIMYVGIHTLCFYVQKRKQSQLPWEDWKVCKLV